MTKVKNTCLPTSSNCIVWDGPDIPCLRLCKGDTITDVLYKLATDYCELLLQFDPSKYDISCFNYIGCAPEDFSELLQIIINKICDIEKLEGPQGPAGSDGTNGADGDTLKLTPVPPGPNCLCGGALIQIISGETGNTINQYYLCNGCPGDPGEPGATGETGPIGSTGASGSPGLPGQDGLTGRGIAVFVQETEPSQTDFDIAYGNIPGFGINNLPGSDQIKPGDLWIGNCDEQKSL